MAGHRRAYRCTAAGVGRRAPDLRPDPAGHVHARHRRPLPVGVPHGAGRNLAAPPALARLLRPWFPTGLPDNAQLVRCAEYTFRAAVANRWRDGRVFLLGDAAHLTPPFIGQGLGTGIRDAVNLTWKLAGVRQGRLAEDALDTYPAERRPQATRIIRNAVAIGWALTGGQDRAAAARRAAITVLCRLPGIASLVLTSTMPRLRPGPLIARGGLRSPNGLLLPQPGRRRGEAWFDDRLGAGYALVIDQAPAAAVTRRAADLGVAVVNVATEPVLRAWLRRRASHAALVRPDRVVAASARRRRDAGALLDAVPIGPHPHPVGVALAAAHRDES
jgi:3-(3-hydroxy-phenyl)propionate hydroxylase